MTVAWQVRPLGDILQTTGTFNPLSSPEREFYYVDVSSISNKTFEIQSPQLIKGKDAPSRARRLIRANDILFATVRPTLQRIAVVPEYLDGQICSTAYLVLRPKPTATPKYLFYFLLTDDFTARIEALQRGASYPAVTDGDVRAQQIPLPPLPEQERIVSILDKALDASAATLASTQVSATKARAVFTSELNATFQKGARAWPLKPLKTLCAFQGGAQPPKSTFSYVAQPNHVRFLQIRDFTSDKHITYIPNSKKNRLCAADDILIARYGASVGQIHTGKGGAYNVALIKTAPNSREVARDFFHAYLLSDFFQSRLAAVANRSAQNGFSKDDIGDFPVPCPPMDEQRRVADFLSDLRKYVGNLCEVYDRKLHLLSEIKTALLHAAFNGDL